MRIAILALFACVAFVLAGCHASAPDWLQGTWIYDAELTEKHLVSPDPAVFTDLVGSETIFTSSELRRLVQGNGKETSYQVVTASPTECLLKFPDGTLSTYYRTDTGISYNWNLGPITLKVYLKRKP